MNNEKKISPQGESWDEYRKKHYTVEEIAENDLMVKLVGEMIKTRKENMGENLSFLSENKFSNLEEMCEWIYPKYSRNFPSHFRRACV